MMTSRLAFLRAALFGLGVCAALGFGAASALAAPPRCPRGSSGAEQCQATCVAQGLIQSACVTTDTGALCCYCRFQ